MKLNKEEKHDGFDICRTSQDYLKQKRMTIKELAELIEKHTGRKCPVRI